MINAAFLYGGAWLRVSGHHDTLAQTVREGGWTYAVISADGKPIDDAVLLATKRGLAEDDLGHHGPKARDRAQLATPSYQSDPDTLAGPLEQTGFA